MDAGLRTQVAFHLTAHRPKDVLEPAEAAEFRPALLARYRDLAALRHDVPLVLVEGEAVVRSLGDLVEEAVRALAPRGPEGEKLRRHALRIEQAIRRRVYESGGGTLSALWDQAGAPADLADSAARLRAAIDCDGAVIGCDGDMPARLVRHGWAIEQRRRLAGLRDEVARLAAGLDDILAADRARSDAGRSAQALRASVGAVHRDDFDFDAMSRILTRVGSKGTLPAPRRERILAALAALRDPPFPADDAGLDGYVFTSCRAAVEAFRTRLPKLVAFVKATAIARLEIDGSYVEAEHDPFFAGFREAALGAADLARFPDHLVCLRSDKGDPAELAHLMEILTANLPIKVLAQVDDILGAPSVGDGALALGGARLAPMAVGVNDVFVLQSAASNLYAMRERLAAALAARGAALVSVFSGACPTSTLPPYLTAAAAMQARAFPAFCYDPSRGRDLAERFSLATNPQPAADWPVQRFAYEDGELQRVEEDLPFTFVDLVACDTRHRYHFARVPRPAWGAGMMPAARFIDVHAEPVPEFVPFVWLVDADGRLERAIVEEGVIAAARRCRDMWHHLQSLAGAHAAPAATAPAARTPAATAAAPAPATADAPAPSGDDPHIETARCTSCNECIAINGRMFAYNAEKQAYIADAAAGTYRQLVEAAEACPVSIIHPGKPRNPAEPALDDLLKRAEPFR